MQFLNDESYSIEKHLRDEIERLQKENNKLKRQLRKHQRAEQRKQNVKDNIRAIHTATAS